MKRIAHIQGQTITNVSLALDDAELAPGTMLEADALAAGYTYAPPELTPEQAIAAARAAMAAILDALPVADRAVVLPIRTSVEAAFDRDDIELAHYTVQTATIPTHLEPTRAQILVLFPNF